MSRFGVGFMSAGVPGNDSFTKILLHFNGANGSTSYPDVNVGGSAHSWSNTGGAGTSISTGIIAPKFGAGSLLTGISSGIKTANSADLNLGSGDWTVDFWWNPNGASGGGFQGLFGQSPAAGFLGFVGLYAYRDNANKIQASALSNSAQFNIVSASTFTSPAWVHIAFVRSGGNLLLFANGLMDGTTPITGSVLYNPGASFGIGCVGDQAPYSTAKFIQEFRLSVGIARWTSNFTPSASQYI